AGDPPGHDSLEAPGRVKGDQARTNANQLLNQLVQAFAVARDGKGLSTRQHVNVQAVLRYVDADINRVHLNPSLRNRARFAAKATVRVRWKSGRRPELRYGLQSPRVIRSPVRHRIGQPSRFGD